MGPLFLAVILAFTIFNKDAKPIYCEPHSCTQAQEEQQEKLVAVIEGYEQPQPQLKITVEGDEVVLKDM
jgi:hypothetical protein